MTDKNSVYSGAALSLEFRPLVENLLGKEVIHDLKFITFPTWLHNVQINNKIFKVLGSDLIEGMPIFLNGEVFPIVKIMPIKYHGIIIRKDHPFGYPGKANSEQYSFKRVVENNVDNWIVEKKSLIKNNYYSKEMLENSMLDKNQLISMILKIQDNNKLLKEDLDTSLKNYFLLKKELQKFQ